MEKNIVYCGLDCAQCPIYIATKNNDEELRKKTAEEWNLDVDDLYCDMCNTNSGRLAPFCLNCPIRDCAQGNNFSTCAECPDYPCEILAEPHAKYPEQRKNLDAIRKTLFS
jgi:hypothetical protein